MAATWLFWATLQVIDCTVGALPAMSAILSMAQTHLPLSVTTTLSLVTVGWGSSIRRGISMGMDSFQSLAVSSVLTMNCTPVAPPVRLTMVVMNQCLVGASYTMCVSEMSPPRSAFHLYMWSMVPSRLKK